MREIAPGPPGGLPLPHRDLSPTRVAAAGRPGWRWPLRRSSPTCYDDGPLLRAALAEAGVDAATAVWNDPAVDWAGLRPRRGQRGLGQHPPRRRVPGLDRRHSSATGSPWSTPPPPCAGTSTSATCATSSAAGVPIGADAVGGARCHGRPPNVDRWCCPRARSWSSRPSRAAATTRRATEPHEHDAARAPHRRRWSPRAGSPWCSPTSPRSTPRARPGLVFLGGALQPRRPQGPDDPARRRAPSTT